MALKPARLDIDYYNGDDCTLSYKVKEGGSPVDLDGHNLTLTIKKTKKGDVITTLSTDASTITVSGADSNTVNLLLNNDFDEERDYMQDLYDSTLGRAIWYGDFSVTQKVHED